jgi:hypothetical protein
MTLKDCASAKVALSEVATAKDNLMKAFKEMQRNGDSTKSSEEQYAASLKEVEVFALCAKFFPCQFIPVFSLCT